MYRASLEASRRGADRVVPPVVPLHMFLERVTVQGFEECRRARTGLERLFWLAVVCVAAVLFTREAKQLVDEIADGQRRSSYDWRLVDTPAGLPLPNITVCVEADFNKSRVAELFYIAPEILQSKEAKESGLTSRDTLVDRLAAFYAPHSHERKLSTPEERVLQRVFSHPANEAISKDTSALILSLSPSCPSMMTQCWFGGQPFPCCDWAVFSSYEGYACYKLPLDASAGRFAQTGRGPQSGVTFTARFDADDIPFRDSDGAAPDGFIISVGQEATFISAPFAAWPGSHVSIVVSGRRKVSSTKCMPNSVASLKYYDHYDTEGAFCISEFFSDKLLPYVGCHVPGYGYLPNASLACSANVFPLLGKANAMHTDSQWESLLNDNAALMKTTKKLIGDMFGAFDVNGILLSFRQSGVCAPLCDKWDPALSVSYSALQESPGQWDSSARATRITMFYGELAFEELRERAFVESYAIFYGVGGLAEFYLGASVVTFVQLLSLGAWCTGRTLRARAKVAPGGTSTS